MHLINQLFVLLLGDGIFLGVYSHPRHTPREYYDRQQNNLESNADQYAFDLHHVARRDQDDALKLPSPALDADLVVVENGDNKKSKKKELGTQLGIEKEPQFTNNSNIIPSAVESAPVVTSKVTTENTPSQNETIPVKDTEPPSLDATERGVIVFSSIAVFSVCYYLYKRYRRKSQMGDNSLTFEPGEQFKYGILSSNESRDNYEMSNVPLTAESDDEDELEIFDLEGRKHAENAILSKVSSANERLLPKDVEILDLDLPGVARTSHPENMNDEDLLDLDDEIDEILTKPSSKDTNSKNFNPSKNNDKFFDNL